MSDTFGIGIIGTGGVALHHYAATNSLENVEVVAACDIDRIRLEAFTKEHPVANAYTDVDELLKDPAVRAVHVLLESILVRLMSCHWEILVAILSFLK